LTSQSVSVNIITTYNSNDQAQVQCITIHYCTTLTLTVMQNHHTIPINMAQYH